MLVESTTPFPRPAESRIDLAYLPITAGKTRLEQRTGSQLLWQVAAIFGVTRLEGRLQNHRQSWRLPEDEPVMSTQAT